MKPAVLRADARCLPLPDASVDLIVTSPPYFGLRSYTDGGEHYDGQIGSEATPAEWLAALVECTREWVRVLKPSGSIFVNLGDKYASGGRTTYNGTWRRDKSGHNGARPQDGAPDKSLLGLPWRYALACTDQLGLILRRDIIWSKPNGLPESVTDRCRSSHEYVFHLVKQPRYYAAVDEIREPHAEAWRSTGRIENRGSKSVNGGANQGFGLAGATPREYNALGKLPGSVWDIPSQPLTVPAHLGIDHFACVDTETEILTQRGWLRHDELTTADRVAGYDLDTDTARWTDCSAVHRYDYDGDMIAVESRDLSMRLTPNHRTIVQHMTGRANKRSPVTVVRADELSHRHFIPRSAAWERCGDFIVGDRLAALMGWVAAEGWYQGGCVYLSQSLEKNGPNVAAIDKLTTYDWRTERKRIYQGRLWTEVTWKVGIVAPLIHREMPDKLLPWWLVTSSEQERRAVLGAFIDGDGHRRPDGRIGIYQKLRHNLDVLQAVAVTLGYKTTLRETGGRFVLYLTEGGRSITLRGTSGIGSKVGREHYKGTVWCPTTGTGTFIARRNGSVFVTGNSFPMELPRRIILGWSPPGVCVACGEGRRPVAKASRETFYGNGRHRSGAQQVKDGAAMVGWAQDEKWRTQTTITGYACACPTPDAPTRPAVVLDPFGGTGTTALVAAMHGRLGISVDRSADYCRLAAWRTTDPAQRAAALQVPKPPPISEGQVALFPP